MVELRVDHGLASARHHLRASTATRRVSASSTAAHAATRFVRRRSLHAPGLRAADAPLNARLRRPRRRPKACAELRRSAGSLRRRLARAGSPDARPAAAASTRRAWRFCAAAASSARPSGMLALWLCAACCRSPCAGAGLGVCCSRGRILPLRSVRMPLCVALPAAASCRWVCAVADLDCAPAAASCRWVWLCDWIGSARILPLGLVLVRCASCRWAWFCARWHSAAASAHSANTAASPPACPFRSPASLPALYSA